MEVKVVIISCLVFSGLISSATAENEAFGNSLWRTKFKAYLSMRFDRDNDGLVSYEDVEAAEDTYAKQYHGDNKNQVEAFKKAYDELWDMMSRSGSSGSSLTYDQVADGMQAAGEAQCRSLMDIIQPYFFAIADTNGDGTIDSDELAKQSIAGVPTMKASDITATFKELDTNNDGYITEDEYVTTFVNFFCTGKSNPIDAMFGL